MGTDLSLQDFGDVVVHGSVLFEPVRGQSEEFASVRFAFGLVQNGPIPSRAAGHVHTVRVGRVRITNVRTGLDCELHTDVLALEYGYGIASFLTNDIHRSM